MKIQNLLLIVVILSSSAFAQTSLNDSSTKQPSSNQTQYETPIPGLDYRCVRNAASIFTGEEVRKMETIVRAVDPQGIDPVLQSAVKKMNESLVQPARNPHDPSRSRTNCFSE